MSEAPSTLLRIEDSPGPTAWVPQYPQSTEHGFTFTDPESRFAQEFSDVYSNVLAEVHEAATSHESDKAEPSMSDWFTTRRAEQAAWRAEVEAGEENVTRASSASESSKQETPYTKNDASALRSLLGEEFLPQAEIKVFEREGFRYVVARPHETRISLATGKPAPPILYVPGATRDANDRGPLTAARLADVCGQPVVTVHRNKTEWGVAFKSSSVKPVNTNGPERYVELDAEHAKPFIAVVKDNEVNEALDVSEASGEAPVYDVFAYSRGTNLALLTIQANPKAFEDIFLHQAQGFGGIRTVRRTIKGLRTAVHTALNKDRSELQYGAKDLGIPALTEDQQSALPNRAEQLSIVRARNLEQLVSRLRVENPRLRWTFGTDRGDIAPSRANLVKALGDSKEVTITNLGGHGIKRAHGIYRVTRAVYQKLELERQLEDKPVASRV